VVLTIRPETPRDLSVIRHVNEQAFGRKVEADIVDKLRRRGVLTLSLVAVRRGEVKGHIAFSPVVVESEGSSFDAVALAPIAVLPACQRHGIGGRLVRAGLEGCRNLGHEIVVVVGHPAYYPRFGFVPAGPKGMSCEFEVPEDVFMVLELRAEALGGRGGVVKFQPELSEPA
jgi:putative acetyltransferase